MTSSRTAHSEGHSFAQRLQNLLNQTVCNGVTISDVWESSRDVVQVGHQITKRSLTAKPIPLGKDNLFLFLSYVLKVDPCDSDQLVVESSVIALTLDVDQREPLMHFDYEREKRDNYPDAHLQIPAEHEAWNTLKSRVGCTQSFGQLHSPVGHHRYYRPSLEDVIEFLLTEQIVRPRVGHDYHDAMTTISKSRAEFHDRQFRKVVAAQPEDAADVLRSLGFDVISP